MTPASVEPVQEPVGSPIRKNFVKRVKFQVAQKYIIFRKVLYNPIPHSANATILTITDGRLS